MRIINEDLRKIFFLLVLYFLSIIIDNLLSKKKNNKDLLFLSIYISTKIRIFIF